MPERGQLNLNNLVQTASQNPFPNNQFHNNQKHPTKFCYEVGDPVAGEMVQELKVFAAPAEDLDTVPITHTTTHNCLNSRGI